MVWGGLIALLIWGVQSLVRREDPRSPLDIAKERLARGEITAQEFEQIRQALESK
jgi:putative membrane protein